MHVHEHLLDPKTRQLRALRLAKEQRDAAEAPARAAEYARRIAAEAAERAAARIERTARRAAEAATRAAERNGRIAKRESGYHAEHGTIGDFWDRVDQSGGTDACHPWRGGINTTWQRDYNIGEFVLAECATKLVHRVVLFLTHGREVPPEHDVVPSCGNRLCCNERHLQVKFGRGKERQALDARDYFAKFAPTTDATN